MPNIRLKIRDFIKKYKNIIIAVLVVWAIVIIINYVIGNAPKIDTGPITTYKPHTAVMDSSEVPQKLQNPIEEKIAEFIKACNNKDYEKAYSLLSQACKKNVYPEIDNFKEYVDVVFYTKKIHNIQNFSNKDGNYIYYVTILDDIMATGSTDMEDIDTYEEMFTMKEEDGEVKISIRGYIGNDKIDQMYEDEYLKITIDDVKINYDTMTYYAKVRNKTDDIIVLADFSESYEISLYADGFYRKLNGLFLEKIIVKPEETKNLELTFARYYD